MFFNKKNQQKETEREMTFDDGQRWTNDRTKSKKKTMTNNKMEDWCLKTFYFLCVCVYRI